MTTTTQTPVVTPYNTHFGGNSSAAVVYSYVSTPQSTTPPQSSSASSSQHQSPIQQDSSDCGSSSGVGGSGMTNKHESDASSLDSDSRDSGAGLPQQQPPQLQQHQQQLQHHQHGILPLIAQNNGILAQHHGYPSHIIPHQNLQHQQQQQQHRYPQQPHPSTTHPRHWAPTTTIPPPPLPPPGVSLPPPPPVSTRPLYTMTVSPGNGYDSRQPSQSSTIITAGPTMTAASNSMGTIPGGISSPSINGSSNSGTTTNNPATSGIPTQSQPLPTSNGTHDVFVHIQAGEVISLLAGSDVQQIKGPATIRMIGQSNISPNALPLRVPQGHLVQQILDEHGRLKHVILSPQGTTTTASAAITAVTTAGTRSNNVGVVPNVIPIARGSGATTPLKGIIPNNAIPSTSNGNGASPKSISPPVPIQFSQGPLMNPEMIADPNYLAIRSLQQQQTNQWNGSKRSSSGYVGPTAVPIPLPPDALIHPTQYAAMQGYSILPHSLPPTHNNIIHTGNPYNGLIPGSGPIGDETDYEFEEDERERERLKDALASIAAPQIQRVYPKEVEVTWQEIDTSEAAASGGPFPQIDASEFIYEVFVYEGKPQGPPASCQRCEPQSGNVLKIEKLKPNTQYCVNIRATLPERDVTGALSQPTFFRTLSILHEIPPPPKIGNRGPTWMQVSCKNALNMSLLIKTIVVQYAKAKGEFMTFNEVSSDQVRITNLEPLTSYRVRIILRTDMGDTEPSPPSYAQTSASNLQQQGSGIPQQQSIQPLQQQQQQHPHQNGPSSSSSSYEIKIPPPQINGCFNRSIRLVWAPVYGFHNYTLEYCESRSNDFHPIEDREYTNNGACVRDLQSNREYYFRLCVSTESGQTLRSEVISARTRKDHFENSAYQPAPSNSNSATSGAGPNTSSYYDNNNRDRLQIPSNLQKVYIDEKIVELSWRYNGREFDTLIFILEGTIASAENNTQPESSWRICYKGPNTSAIINDTTLNLFRVQAMNSRKHVSSTWSEPLFVKRVVQRSKRSIADSSSNNSIPSTPAPTTSSIPSVIPSTCSVPKFSEITWCSMQVQWKLSEDLSETSNNKISLIYELQRVDTEPIIIYSGDQTSHKIENLKPIEHVQVRVRAVIVDYSGKRNEGDWSPIGSACTTCTAPSPPINLRLAVEGPTPTLAWDPPAQLNGADIKSYVLTGTKTPLTGEGSEKPILKRFGDTSKTEFCLGKIEPATHFAIKIIAISKGGESDASEIFEFDSAPSEPETPQELHIEAISSTELSLSWTPGAENGSPIIGYHILVHELSSESRSASKHLIAQHQLSEDITTFIASKLKPETLYEIEISAKNSVGTSESVSMRCETFASPPDPPELSLVQAQSNVLKLKWQPAIASSSSSTVEPCYFYLEKENDFGTFSPVFEGESKMAKIKNLHEDTVHRFRIRSAHAKGIASLMGPWSETYEFSTTRPPPPSVKGSLMVSEVSQSVFQIEWLPVKLVTNDGTDNFVYRLQVVPKPERRSVLEPWKTVYEGTCPSYTLSLSPQSSTARMARVFVVQKLGSNNEELCSAPSAIAQFSSCRTPNESPRKRVNKAANASSGNSTPSQPSEDDQPTRSPSSVHRANRMNWQRRTKKWINFVRKSFADRNSSAVVLVCIIVLILVYLMMV
jgi:hypothetical protein